MGNYLAAFGHDIRISAAELSEDPDTQVAQVVALMREYTAADRNTPELIADADRAASIAGDPLSGVHSFVKRRLRFVPDDVTAGPFTSFCRGPIVETLIRPIDIRAMRDPQGDCDDFSMYTAALLGALGIPAAFCTVAVDPEEPWRFSHVYVVAYPNGRRIALDCSHGPYAGWECPNLFGKRQEWPIDGGGGLLLAGGALLALGAGLYMWGARQ